MAPSDSRDPRRLLASRDEEDDDAVPLAPAQLSDVVGKSKLASYDQGIVRKSKREREAEAAEAKAKEEEELAARAYSDFVEAFGGDDDGGQSSRGGRGGRGSRYGAGKGFVSAGGGERYNPLKDREPAPSSSSMPGVPTGPRSLRMPGAGSADTAPGSSRPAAAAAMLMNDDEPKPRASSSSGPPGKKKRDGDSFLEQLKREQAEREERLKQKADRMGSSVTALAARENAPVLTGSYDTGDPLTTNIHVSPLPQNVTEDSLGNFFARYGPIGSVKIMWPRVDPSTTFVGRRQLSGFVAFMRRPDAEKAAKELDGVEWGGCVIKLSWGKPVPVPTRSKYEIEGASSRSDRERERHHRSSRRRSRSRSRSRSPKRHRSYSPDDERSRAERQWPTLEEGIEERFLRTIANRILEHGSAFEHTLREKERSNSKFDFFRNDRLPSYHYFKMLLDRDYQPSMTVKFEDEGLADIYSSDSAEDSENERTLKGRLGKLAQKRFEALLRDLRSTREKIACGMAFALEHADAASLIVDLLVASLTLDATPVPRKIARLHLVSDILHNSSAPLPNAWVYRSTFEERLPVVFDHLGEIYRSFPGRMKAEQFRLQVSNILDVWERDWILFEPKVFDDLRRRLSGISNEIVEEKPLETTPTTEASPSAPPATISSNWAPVASTSTASKPAAPAPPRAPSPIPGLAPPPPVSAKKPQLKFGGFKTTFMPSGLPEVPKEPEIAAVEAKEEHQGGDVDRETVSMSKVKQEAEEDVDEEPMDVENDDEDVDGVLVPIDGGKDLDGAPVDLEADVDGASVDLDADVDGPPVDPEEDVDGDPVDIAPDVNGAPVDLAEDYDGAPVELVEDVDLDADLDGQAVDLTGDVDGTHVDLVGDVDGEEVDSDDMFDGVPLGPQSRRA